MSVLVYLKNMPYSVNAVTFGGLIARLLKTDVRLLHVLEKNTSQADAEQQFTEAETLLSNVHHERIIRSGDPFNNIIEEMVEGSYQMIVLRARSAIRFRERLAKKIARLVAIESPISVLIVKDDGEVSRLNRILVCTGGKDVANPVIHKGAALAKASAAELTLLHITTPVPSMYTGMDEIEETMEELLQTETPTAQHLRTAANILAQYDIEAKMEVRQGDVTEEILDKSASEDYDLILVGAPPGDNRLKEWFMGDVTRNLVNHADCAVLVVR